MDSYEFDQPLDLRLKALNLSLSTYQHQHPALSISKGDNIVVGGGCGDKTGGGSQSSIASGVSIWSSSSSSNSSISSQCETPINNNITAIPFVSQHRHQHHRLPQSTLPAQQYHHQLRPTSGPSPLRLTNVHRQPLNHHQPHPLSRLHPTPSNLQQCEKQQLPLQTPARTHQLSPQQRQYYQMPPKSISMSNYSMATKGYSQSTTPPTIQLNNNNKQQLSGAELKFQNLDSNLDYQVNDIACQLPKLNSVIPQISTNGPSVYDFRTNSPTNNPTSSPDCKTREGASPITRQHSLVSRYHCKPCGIVFSQPETLRAHQEGYCTKRECPQTQVRSQSAVSPVVVQTQGVEIK